MLRRLAQPRAEICLRCSFRLFQHNLRPLSHFPARQFTPNENAASEGPSSTDGAPSQDNADPTRHPRTFYKPKQRRRRAGNRVLTEDSATLGTEMLGKPARAIVLRDGGLYVRTDKTEEFEAEPSPELPNLEALLESQQSDPTTEDVRANIESLKPVHERQLSERDFRKLQQTLIDGFTTPQLQGYLQWRADKPLHKTSSERMAMRLPWVKSMTPWTPLSQGSETVLPGDAPIPGYMPATASPKERVAIRILHECWGLTINELAMVLGEVRVRVRSAEFVLLMRGTQRFMNELGKQWLEPGERIESIRSSCTLRFVVKKPKADIIIAELDKTLNCIESKAIPLSLFTPTPLDEGVIEELGRITNTHIRNSQTGRRIHITWLEVRKKGQKAALEDLRHVVFRLLLTALRPAHANAFLFSDLPPESRGGLVADRINSSKWGWRDRMSTWERFVVPVQSSEAAEARVELPSFTVEKLAHAPKDIRLHNSSAFGDSQNPGKDGYPVQPVSWGKTVQTTTVVHYGHVLHARSAAAELNQLPSATVAELSDAGLPRIFSPVSPHPTRLAELEAQSQEDDEPKTGMYPAHSTILIRFQPSPRVASAAADEYALEGDKKAQLLLDEHGNPLKGKKKIKNALREIKSEKKKEKKRAGPVSKDSWPMAEAPPAPILELRLTIEDTKVLGIQSLRAIKHKTVSDVMLPGSLIDMRVTQTQYVELEGQKDDIAAWQPLADFLGNARIELDRGKVDMASRQRFPIPRHLFSTEELAGDPNELVSTQYEFVGLELHRAVSMPYEGFKMTYTSIEAGQGGGRRAEFSVEEATTASPSTDTPMAEASQSEEYASDETVLETELDVDPAKESATAEQASTTTEPPSRPTRKNFLETCYALARDESMWAGYPSDSKEW
ncbi:mitochondrial inner-membrane-bound regulator-domain-containing protein [Microdochium trichocladiopsis]|uniref:Mitochondrial inner-membrane-bound regulator-domain-containing protein n=1 Tax=Microdochium trichocladiopsis TaxID=1682393 RepID=A0A9P8YE35_9PEZI|nr:mitochondrial inner-membrane-bound regulator-domain-containing protein [Microdochium trichocladiopsis]KAH7037638.1 mitochondrial inner-membrane-bound regulator-domain-containing protein [Microdochium trichocladiopsis]